MQDQIVETKVCKYCQSSFHVTQDDLDFYTKMSPTLAGTKYQIPNPTLCPDCRQQRRMAFRNERNLYRRTCDASGKQIISIYSPDKPYKVFDQKIWWSDSWDAMDYGMEFDFNKTFTEQFGALSKTVPRSSLCIFDSENCDYANEIINCKSSYLIFSGVEDENCLYYHYVDYSKSCMDCDQCIGSELCHNCFAIINCYKCFDSNHCRDSNNLKGCSFCVGCSHCINCSGLTNQSYCIDNKQVSQQEFERLSQNIIAVNSLWNNDDNWIINSENCSGAYITNSNNVTHSKNIQNSKDCKWCLRGAGMTDCYDCFINGVVPNAYFLECMTVGPGTHNLYMMNCRPNVSYSLYCDSCSNSSHCFGCIGLRNKEYCIFNKQYSKDKYEKIVGKIIEHMLTTGERGEFFHPSLSPFGYNETVAQEYYPLIPDIVGTMHRIVLQQNNQNGGQGGALSLQIEYGQLGYHRSNYEAPKPVSDKVVKGADLPNSIDVVEDSILQNAIECEISGKLFRIQPQELVFYRKHNIPLSRKHPDVRHLERLELRK